MPYAPAAGYFGPSYRICQSFMAGSMKIYVSARHTSCRKAVRVQKAYWLGPEDEKELVGPNEYNGYVRLKRFPGWRCTSGAGAGSCNKGRKSAAYNTFRPRSRGARIGAKVTYYPQGQDPHSRAYRPHFLAVAGEGSFNIRQVKWASWGHSSAHGQGIGAQDDCEPDCATGTFHRAPVRIVLRRGRMKCGHRIWTRMNLNWVQGPPPGLSDPPPRHEVWTLGVFPC